MTFIQSALGQIAKLTTPEAEAKRREAEQIKSRAEQEAAAKIAEADELERLTRQQAVAIPFDQQLAEWRSKIITSVLASPNGYQFNTAGTVSDPTRRDVWAFHHQAVADRLMQELDRGDLDGLAVVKIDKQPEYLITARRGKFPKSAIIDGVSPNDRRRIWGRLCSDEGFVTTAHVPNVEDWGKFRKSITKIESDQLVEFFTSGETFRICRGPLLR